MGENSTGYRKMKTRDRLLQRNQFGKNFRMQNQNFFIAEKSSMIALKNLVCGKYKLLKPELNKCT